MVAEYINPTYRLRWTGAAHDAAGRPDSAIVWLERFVNDPTTEIWTKANYLPRVHRRLGELYEARGDTEKAVEHYTAFVELWKNADPVLQPEVDEARRRINQLQGIRG